MIVPLLTPLNKIRDLVEDYGQYSILYSGPETAGHVKNYENTWPKKDLGPLHSNRIAQFYSTNLGRPLVFESLISGWIWRS